MARRFGGVLLVLVVDGGRVGTVGRMKELRDANGNRLCAWCGEGPLPPSRGTKPRAYCSRSCVQRAYEARKEQERQDQALALHRTLWEREARRAEESHVTLSEVPKESHVTLPDRADQEPPRRGLYLPDPEKARAALQDPRKTWVR